MKNIFIVIKFIFSVINKFPLRLIELLGQIFPENSSGCRIRGLMYKPFLKECGSNFQVGLSVKLEFCNNIKIGKDVYIGHGCWLSGLNGGLEFEDEVMLGPGVKMVSSNHSFLKGSSRFAPSDGKLIKIKRGSWLASNVLITSGVEIGESCLVAAGAVVTKSQPANSVIAGVPANVIKAQPN